MNKGLIFTIGLIGLVTATYLYAKKQRQDKEAIEFYYKTINISENE